MRRYDRIKAVVSLDAIAHNFGEMKKNIAKGTKIIAVIKADGYGHGADEILGTKPKREKAQNMQIISSMW